MARVLCHRCDKPEKSCICRFFSPITNTINIVLLQHPTEAKQSKGSAPLLINSLSRCELITGEDFTENDRLNQLLSDQEQRFYLLYPSAEAKSLECLTLQQQNDESLNFDNVTLILIDATWKKSYRMYQLSRNLHSLIHITLPEGLTGHYLIRKTKKANALSTLEACLYALSVMESCGEKYQPLLEKFKQFNQFQLSFRR